MQRLAEPASDAGDKIGGWGFSGKADAVKPGLDLMCEVGACIPKAAWQC